MSDWLRFRRRDTRDRARDDPGDARPVAGPVRQSSPDPEQIRGIKLRRRALVLGLGGICLAGSVAAFIGEGGYVDMLRLRGEIAALQNDIEQRSAEVGQLENEVRALEQDPVTLERIAREQLGLIRPQEIDFLLPREGEDGWEPGPADRGERRP